MPEFNDNKGVSLVLVNSEKGERLIANMKDNTGYIIKRIPNENIMQPQLMSPTKKGKLYNYFWKCYSKDRDKAIERIIFFTKLTKPLKRIKNKLMDILKIFP